MEVCEGVTIKIAGFSLTPHDTNKQANKETPRGPAEDEQSVRRLPQEKKKQNVLMDKRGISSETSGGDGNVSPAIWTFVKTTEFYEVERMKERTNIKERSSKWVLLC